MFEFQADKLTKKDNYKLLSGSIIPRPVALVTTLEPESGTVNIAPFSFFSVVSSDPPIIMLSVFRTETGAYKDTARNALATGELVLHICHCAIAEEMTKTAADTPPDVSELELCTFTKAESEHIAVPGIKEALLRFECKVVDKMMIKNDADEVKTDVLFLRVLKYYVSASIFNKDKMYILPQNYQPLARLSGEQFATLGEIFKLAYL